MKKSYRADVDGLRAIAILLVVFYHLRLGVHSGFVGVDVFFVISGFLIGSKILPEIEQRKFSVKAFWKNRVKRLLPAATFTIIATLIVGWFFLLPPDYRTLAESSLSHLFLSSNIYFWKETHYFTGSSHNFWLLHTWSLSVEEQFYVILPLFLTIALILSKKIYKWLFVLSLLVSFVLCLYASRNYQTPNYFLLPTRWWEMGVGILIPMFNLKPAFSQRSSAMICLLGIAMICVSGFIVPSTLFPSEYALLPVIGTLLVICTGYRDNAASRALAWKPLVFIGLVSYSWYLWHWPVHCLFAYRELGGFDYTLTTRVIALLASFLLAVVTWKFIENRYRGSQQLTKAKKYEFGTAIFAMLVITSILVVWKGAPSRLPDSALKILESKPPEKGVMIEIKLPSEDKRYHYFGKNNKEAVKIALWGDSHAAPYLPLFQQMADEGRIQGFAALCASTPPLLNYIPTHFYSIKNKAPSYNKTIFNKIIAENYDIVLLASIWNAHFDGGAADSAIANLAETVKLLEDSGVMVIIAEQAPRSESFHPRLLAYHDWKDINFSFSANCSEHRQKKQYEIFNQLGLTDRTVSVVPEMKSQNGHFIPILNIRALFYDDQHLSKWGGMLLRPALEKVIDDFSEKPR